MGVAELTETMLPVESGNVISRQKINIRPHPQPPFPPHCAVPLLGSMLHRKKIQLK